MAKIPIITIDGPSGAGKGTLGRLLAEDLGFHFLDSGALYRVLAYAANRHGMRAEYLDDILVLAEHLDVSFRLDDPVYPARVMLEGEDVTGELRTETVGEMASKLAALEPVRKALLARQRAFVQSPGLVADGRDMGTVVFPEAPVKIFLTASASVRAKRRQKQLHEGGKDVKLTSLLEDIQRRDERDCQRVVSPLKPAEDAVVIDTSQLDIKHVLLRVKDEIEARILLA
jgi:cytidylate kinase